MGEKELGMTIPIREMAKGVRIKRDNLLINRTTESVKVPITIHLPEDLKSKVDRYKKAYFRTFSSLVEKLVSEWLEAVEEEEARNEKKKTYIEYRCDECNKIIPYGSEIAVKTNSDGWWPYELFCSESCFVKCAKRKAKLEKVTWEYKPEYEYIASPENGFLVEFISEHDRQPYFGNYKYIIFDECRIEFDSDYRMSVGMNECLEPIDTTSDCETPSINWIERAFDYKKTVERFGAFEVLHCTDYEEYRNYLRNMRKDFPIDLLNFCIEYLKNGENKLIERMEMFRGMEKFVVLKCVDKYALIRFT